MKKNRIGFFWYNIDRAGASLCFGTSQETISSEVGRIARGQWTPRFEWQKRLALGLANWLDKTPRIWGVDHTKKAIEHADALDAVDDGKEQ